MTANLNPTSCVAPAPAEKPRFPSSPLVIEIDDRERSPSVIAHLRATGDVDVRHTRLAIGDYRVDQALVFERKTLIDLVASIKDGRLFRQALRLVESRRPCALILEGRSDDLLGRGMSWPAIQGALISVTLMIGVPVLRTRNPAETARTLCLAGRQYRTVVSGARPRRGSRPAGKAALQCQLLQVLPGVGPKRAVRLLRQFGSIQAVVAADPLALAQVDGIGSHVATKIRWVVEEQPLPYLASTTSAAAALPRRSLGCRVS